MPTYEYQCKACGKEFELEQRITEKPIKKCPSCGKFQVRRLISNTSFVLRGGGWYSDGYHGSGSEKKASVGTAGESSSKSSDTGSDANSTTATKAKTASSKTKK